MPPPTPRASGGLVYSTDSGRMCPQCSQPVAGCRCRATAQAAQAAAGDGTVRVGRETGGRGGKVVSVVRGVPLAAEPLAALAKRLRSACGAGGTLKDGVIEVQGEHRDRLVALLTAEGFRVKRVGG